MAVCWWFYNDTYLYTFNRMRYSLDMYLVLEKNYE